MAYPYKNNAHKWKVEELARYFAIAMCVTSFVLAAAMALVAAFGLLDNVVNSMDAVAIALCIYFYKAGMEFAESL